MEAHPGLARFRGLAPFGSTDDRCPLGAHRDVPSRRLRRSGRRRRRRHRLDDYEQRGPHDHGSTATDHGCPGYYGRAASSPAASAASSAASAASSAAYGCSRT